MADDKKKKKEKNKANNGWFKDLKKELKKVTWLTPVELAKRTAAVIVIVLVVTVIIFICDLIFNALNEQGIERLKSHVQGNTTEQIENNSTDNTSFESTLNEAIDNVVNNTTDESGNAGEENTSDNVVKE